MTRRKTLPTFSAEIWRLVLSHLELETLIVACLVNHLFDTLATAFIYTHLYVADPFKVRRLIENYSVSLVSSIIVGMGRGWCGRVWG